MRRFSVTRNRTNFDPAIHDGPGFHDIDPDELSEPNGSITLDCAADFNEDLVVNVEDLLRVINAWGSCSLCVINVDDLLLVIHAWGQCP